MLYAILCYHDEDAVGSWSKEQDDAVMAKLAVVQDKLTSRAGSGRSRGCCRPPRRPRCARTDPPLVIDGPFAETKEQLLGFYVIDCEKPRRGAGSRARSRQRPIPAAPMKSARSAISRPGARPST